jgi:hypothetical protein
MTPMLEDADLDAAVAEGIVSPAQAVALREIATRRTRERAISQGHEERFRLMTGFNDLFFAIGVVLFVAGLAYFIGGDRIGRVAIAAIVWGLAELLVARLRLVLPGILLAAAFVGFAILAVPVETWLRAYLEMQGTFGRGIGSAAGMLDALGSTPGLALLVALKALVATAAACAFYWRFRLPFALLPLAGSLVVVMLAAASKILPSSRVWDPVVLLVCALGVFAAAMAFDTSDRERLTRRADCAFWLHLLAAPLIVHSLIWLISPGPETGAPRMPGPYWLNMTPTLAGGIVLVFAVLAVVAILIDRRALLVSGLAYLGAAIAYAITSAKVGSSGVPVAVAGTLTILGAFVLALGVGWMPLRRLVLPLLSAPLANRLPPVPVRS